MELGAAEAILETLAEAVTIRDLSGRIVYANRSALDRLSFATIEELREAAPRVIMDDYLVEGEDGRTLSMDDTPSVRLLRGEAPEPVLMRTISRATGALEWVLLKATPLHDAAGNVQAAVTIIEDVTMAKLAELRARFEAKAGAILAGSLDYQETLRNVAELA